MNGKTVSIYYRDENEEENQLNTIDLFKTDLSIKNLSLLLDISEENLNKFQVEENLIVPINKFKEFFWVFRKKIIYQMVNYVDEVSDFTQNKYPRSSIYINNYLEKNDYKGCGNYISDLNENITTFKILYDKLNLNFSPYCKTLEESSEKIKTFYFCMEKQLKSRSKTLEKKNDNLKECNEFLKQLFAEIKKLEEEKIKIIKTIEDNKKFIQDNKYKIITNNSLVNLIHKSIDFQKESLRRLDFEKEKYEKEISDLKNRIENNKNYRNHLTKEQNTFEQACHSLQAALEGQKAQIKKPGFWNNIVSILSSFPSNNPLKLATVFKNIVEIGHSIFFDSKQIKIIQEQIDSERKFHQYEVNCIENQIKNENSEIQFKINEIEKMS